MPLARTLSLHAGSCDSGAIQCSRLFLLLQVCSYRHCPQHNNRIFGLQRLLACRTSLLRGSAFMCDEAHKSFHALPVQLRAKADQISHQCVDLPAVQQLPIPQCRTIGQPHWTELTGWTKVTLLEDHPRCQQRSAARS